MLQSFAVKFLSSLLVFSLWGATLTLVLNQTVLSSHYLEGRLDATHGYDRLSVALTDEISHSPDLAANPQVATTLQSILTPAVLKTKLNSALDQIQAYYHGTGPQPTIDLSDLAAQAQAAGIPIGQNADLTKPIVIGKPSNQKQTVGQTFDHARLGSLLAVAVLMVALLALSWRQRRYTALPTVFISVGVLIGMLALVLIVAPGFIDHVLKLGSTSSAFIQLGHDLGANIARDLGKRFGIIAAVYLAIGISTRILASRLQSKLTKPTPAKTK